MATKTISIDVEAYQRLKSVQKENESFSQTIKRVIRNVAIYTGVASVNGEQVACAEIVCAEAKG